jgi:hypothetical protein
MTSRLTRKLAVIGLVVVTLVFFMTELQARRFGGGGLGHGGGIAAGGGFSGRGTGSVRGFNRGAGRQFDRGIDRQALRDPGRLSENRRDSQDDRQEFRQDRQEDRQDFAEDRQDDRQDFIEDEVDDWDRCCFDDNGGEFIAGALVGGAIGAAAASDNDTTYIVTLPCTTTAVLYDGSSFYNCAGTWYRQSYAGGEVVYIVTSAPPGY